MSDKFPKSSGESYGERESVSEYFDDEDDDDRKALGVILLIRD